MSTSRKLNRRGKGKNYRARVPAKTVRTTKSRKRHIELKTVDTEFSTDVGTLMSSSAGGAGNAYSVLLSGIATGADYDERIGRDVNLKSLLISATVCVDEVETCATQANIAIVVDNAPTGTLPTADDLYDAYSLRVLENTPRFHVAMKKRLLLRPISSGTTHVQVDARDFLKSVKLNRAARYSASTATIGSISTNAIYLVAWSSADVDFALIGKARLKFTEE